MKTKDIEHKWINDCVPNEEAMAKHAKKLLGVTQPQIGTLISTNGTHTAVGEETAKEIINTHFPLHTQEKETLYNPYNKIKLAEL